MRLPDQLTDQLGIDVGEFAHLEEALTHPSFANEQRGGCRDNQRLEFLGDAVLGLSVGELLMARLPDANEGELSLMRSRLVSSLALAAWARRVDLGPLLRLGRGADAAGERERDSVLADAVEALVGAVYVDLGLRNAQSLSAAIIREPLERLVTKASAQRDPKSELQERVQAEGGSSPRYRVVASVGPDHAREFVVVVEVGGAVVAEGRGRSKKLAEQDAACAAIRVRDGAEAVADAAATRSAHVDVDAVTPGSTPRRGLDPRHSSELEEDGEGREE